jgi:hypothetical protein
MSIARCAVAIVACACLAVGCASTHPNHAARQSPEFKTLTSTAASGEQKATAVESLRTAGDAKAVAILNEFVLVYREDIYLLLYATEVLEEFGNKRSAEVLEYAFYEDPNMPEWPGKVYSLVDDAIEKCKARASS